MKAALSFNIFIRDNRFKLSSQYPFLSQDQILSKLRLQWRQLNDSTKQSSWSNDLKSEKKRTTSKPEVCKSKSSKPSRKTKLRELSFISGHKNKKQAPKSTVYNFESGFDFDRSDFHEDEDEVDSPYLHTKHALDALNSWTPQPRQVGLNDAQKMLSSPPIKVSKQQKISKRNLGLPLSEAKPNALQPDRKGMLKTPKIRNRGRDVHQSKILKTVEDEYEFDDLDIDEERLHVEPDKQTKSCSDKSPPQGSGVKQVQSSTERSRNHGNSQSGERSNGEDKPQLGRKRSIDPASTMKVQTPSRVSKRLQKEQFSTNMSANPKKSGPLSTSKSSSKGKLETKVTPGRNLRLTPARKDHLAKLKNKTQSKLQQIQSKNTGTEGCQVSVCYSAKSQANGKPVCKDKAYGNHIRKDRVALCKKPGEGSLQRLREKLYNKKKETKKTTGKAKKASYSDKSPHTIAERPLKFKESLLTSNKQDSRREKHISHFEIAENLQRCDDNLDMDRVRNAPNEDVNKLEAGLEEVDHCICSDDEDVVLLVRQDPSPVPCGEDDTDVACQPQTEASASISSITILQELVPKVKPTSPKVEAGKEETQTTPAARTGQRIGKDKAQSHTSRKNVRRRSGSVVVTPHNKPSKRTSFKSGSLGHGNDDAQATPGTDLGQDMESGEDFWETNSACDDDAVEEGGCSVFCSQVVTQTNAALLHALMKLKATGSSPELSLDVDGGQSSPAGLSVWSQEGASEELYFKKPVGIMFEDPELEVGGEIAAVNTPGKRRLVSSAGRANPSNFGSMFDDKDIFL